MASSFDLNRLLYEKSLLEASFGDGVVFFHYTGRPKNRWESYGVEFIYSGFHVEGHYHEEHPFKRPIFQIDPEPDSSHYYDSHLCYLKPEHWNPSFTIVTSVFFVIRFLREYRRGRAD